MIHQQYLETSAKQNNKSWRRADNLVRKCLLPKLGKRKISDIHPQYMWRIRDGFIDRHVSVNCALAAASAIFSWAVKRRIIPSNPCSGIERYPTTASTLFIE